MFFFLKESKKLQKINLAICQFFFRYNADNNPKHSLLKEEFFSFSKYDLIKIGFNNVVCTNFLKL